MLTLIEELPERNKWGKKVALYKCHCGKEVTTLMTYVKTGETTSCGCARRGKVHLSRRSPYSKLTRASYQCMIQRCCNPNSSDYPKYGGMGITICERWLENIKNFVDDMGERPDKSHTIHRLENDKGYEPDNCIWADKVTQNTEKGNVRKLTFDGKTQSIAQWGRDLGLKESTLYKRLERMSVERALTLK